MKRTKKLIRVMFIVIGAEQGILQSMSKSKIAAVLGVHRSTVWRDMRELYDATSAAYQLLELTKIPPTGRILPARAECAASNQ